MSFDIDAGIQASNREVDRYRSFENNRRRYKQIPLEKVPEKMIEPQLTGWKIVRIIENDFLNMETIALLELKISGNICTPTGKTVYPNQLKTRDKYCTNECVVSAVQFVGAFNNTIKTLLENFTRKCSVEHSSRQAQNVELVSNFDPNFEYKLGHIVREKEYAKDGVGCVQGIHFFIDKQSCFQYLEGGFAGIPMEWPTITGPIEASDVELEPKPVRKDENERVPVTEITSEFIENIRTGITERIQNMERKFNGLPRMRNRNNRALEVNESANRDKSANRDEQEESGLRHRHSWSSTEIRDIELNRLLPESLTEKLEKKKRGCQIM